MTDTEIAAKVRSDEQLQYALTELNKYLSPISDVTAQSRERIAISVCYDFSRQGRDIRQYVLLEETIFDDKDTFRNKRVLVWKKREVREQKGDGQQTV